MNGTRIFAYGFPNEALFTSILEDENIKAETLDKEKIFAIENIDDRSVFFIYCGAFEKVINELLSLFSNKIVSNPIVMVGENFSQSYLENLFESHPFTYIKLPADKDIIIKELMNAKEGKCSFIPNPNYKEQLDKARANLVAFHEISTALTAEKDIEKLLNLILTQSRHLAKADAGSLYLKEGDNHLRFVLTQNISSDWNAKKDVLIEIKENSISGYTAKISKSFNLLDVYSIPESYPFTYNKTFDQTSGYRNKSMLTMPMYNNNGEVLGVIQLINKRKDYDSRVPGKKLDESQIIPFDNKDVEFVDDLASQAAIALENARLYQEIREMFEGFVKASIVAIEAKDPVTHGHSERVANLTVAMAKTINSINEGPFAKVHFTDKDLLQIRYASLLHDFGKVSISEEVLTKSKKLFPFELENLKSRYKFIRKSVENDYYKNCLNLINTKGIENYNQSKAKLEEDFQNKLNELDKTVELLVKSNEPSVLEESCSNQISELSHSIYKDIDGNETPYLTEREATALSVKRGSLSESERLEIESHVKYSYDFLVRIPWTKDLSRVPEIAYAHHEKMNGRGYPNHKKAEEIPIESQIMGITDIFDALTAQDRPYKPALPLKKALDILRMDAENNALNKDLVNLFESKEVYKCLEGKLKE